MKAATAPKSPKAEAFIWDPALVTTVVDVGVAPVGDRC